MTFTSTTNCKEHKTDRGEVCNQKITKPKFRKCKIYVKELRKTTRVKTKINIHINALAMPIVNFLEGTKRGQIIEENKDDLEFKKGAILSSYKSFECKYCKCKKKNKLKNKTMR